MDKRDYKKEFCTLMDKFAFRYSRWQVWNDFLSLSAISMANVIPTPEKEEREEKYHAILSGYREEEREIFPQMLHLVVLALSDNPEQDFLGSLYHILSCIRSRRGSFSRPTISVNLCRKYSIQI